MRKAIALAGLMLLCACAGDGQPSRTAVPPPAPATQSAVQQAPAQPEPVLVTDSNGMTVYYHDADQPNKSRCNDGCAQYWPPVRPNPEIHSAPGFGVITRKDGTQQLTYEKRPLYTFFNDKKPGDTKGDGKQGIWHALKH